MAFLLPPSARRQRWGATLDFARERERRAADAERELVQWKKVRFMADKVGDEFTGYITGVSSFGLAGTTDVVAVADTQKGAIEIEIFETGLPDRIPVQPGEQVPVGTAMATLRGHGSARAAVFPAFATTIVWRSLYLPVARAVRRTADAIAVLQSGRLSIYLLYSFLTILVLLVFVL